VIGAVAGLAHGRSVDAGLSTSVAVVIWRAHNNNLVLRRGQRSDVDGRQGNAILISDQVKQKDNSSRLKASRRAKPRPTSADPACAQTTVTSLWSMLRTAAPTVADRCSCSLISVAAV
jgi:hypothetical protein